MKYCKQSPYAPRSISCLFKPYITEAILKEPLTSDGIINNVCQVWDIEKSILKSGTRVRIVADARKMAMFSIKKYLPHISLKRIGEIFNNRDHATVITAIKMYSDLMDTDKSFRAKYKLLSDKLDRF